MYIIPIINNQGTSISYRGQFQKSVALKCYISKLNETDLKLFLKNQTLMERVNDGKKYLYTYELTYDNDGADRVRAVMQENGKPIISETVSEAYFNPLDGEVYTQYESAEKNVFDQLFKKYNPKRLMEEQEAYKAVDKLKQAILSKIVR